MTWTTMGQDKRIAATATLAHCVIDALEKTKVIGRSRSSVKGREKRRRGCGAAGPRVLLRLEAAQAEGKRVK